MMLVYYVGGTTHFTTIREIGSIFNTTGRLSQVLNTVENFQRSFFMNRSDPIMNGKAVNAVDMYQTRSHELISLIYDVRCTD